MQNDQPLTLVGIGCGGRTRTYFYLSAQMPERYWFIAAADPNVERLKMARKVLVCHVLRYSAFYVKVKEIIDSGVLGEIVTLDARKGVGPWHPESLPRSKATSSAALRRNLAEPPGSSSWPPTAKR